MNLQERRMAEKENASSTESESPQPEYGSLVCPRCHRTNPKDAVLCMFCGARLKVTLAGHIVLFLIGFLFVFILTIVVWKLPV